MPAKFKPMKHQAASLVHDRIIPTVFDMSDPGTGKTAVRIWAFAKRRKVGGGALLVLCPRSLTRSAWANDFAKFAPDMRVSVATAENRAAAFDEKADVYVTNHDAAKWLAAQPKQFFAKFSELVVDESAAFKHHTSLRSKALRKLVSHKLSGKPIFGRRALLSATPTSNGICDIWHQVALLDDGKRLGNSFYAFRNVVSTPTQVGRNVNALKWEDKEGAEEAVFGLIQDLVIRHRFEDCVDIPARHIYSVKYTLTAKQLRAYEDMEQAQLLVFKDKKKMTAVNAAAVSTKLLQIASGAVYDNDGEHHVVDTARYELIMDLVEARVHPIVFFFWKHQVAALVKEAEKRGMSYAVFDGEASDKRRAEIEAAYQAKQYDVLFAHPKSTAHGLTLTAGTSIIWSGPTADLEWFLQGNRRQARIGQTQKTEVVVVLAEGTYDERVYHEILMPKDGRMKTLLELFS